MNLKNILKFKANDSISIVYFKGKERAHSFYLPYKIFSTIKIIIIACLIWLPISITLLYYMVDNENSSILELSKSKEVILSYQEKIDGVFDNLYASNDQSTPAQSTVTDTTQIQPVPSSLPTETTTTLQENPIDVELNYNKIDETLINVVLKITNKNLSLPSTTGRLLIAFKLISTTTNEESYLLYPKDVISSIIPHVRKGESYKISRFKEINHNFSIPEGFKLNSIKAIVYNNQSQSLVEKLINIEG